MRRLLMGLILSLVASAASAEWVFVAENKSGEIFYADSATKTSKGNIVRMWEMQEYPQPKGFGGNGKSYSARFYEQYDCAERTSQTLQFHGFAGQTLTGEQVVSVSQPSDKYFTPPNTPAELLLNIACK
jgi:hypothetical protein